MNEVGFDMMIFFNGSKVFDAEFLTRSRHAFEERFGIGSDIVLFSNLDLLNYRRENAGVPDTQGMRMEASENLLQGRICLLRKRQANRRGREL